MNLILKENQSEEYYKKILLLDKISCILTYAQKFYIFNQGYCWNILFKDSHSYAICYNYAVETGKPFPEGEKYIALNPLRAYTYAKGILKNRFPLGEEAILNSFYKENYLVYLKKIGKLEELKKERKI